MPLQHPVLSRRSLLSLMAAAPLASALPGWAMAASGFSPEAKTVVLKNITSPEGPCWLPDGRVTAVSFGEGVVMRSVPGAAETPEILATLGRGLTGTALVGENKLMVVRMNMAAFLSQFAEVEADPDDAGQIAVIDLADGSVDILFDETKGDPIKGPNDMTVAADGSVWFSDAVNGNVLYLDPTHEKLSIAAKDITGVNGIALNADDSELYVTDGADLVAYAVGANGVLGERRVVTTLDEDLHPDGMKVQTDGRILVAVGTAGIFRVGADGSNPEIIAFSGNNVVNFAFAGADEAGTLYVVENGEDKVGNITGYKWDGEGVLHNV